MSPRGRRWDHPPPWWPANEPWPPARHRYRTRHRRFFMRRFGLAFAAILLLSAIGATRLVSLVIGPAGAAPVVAVAVPLAVMLIAFAIFFVAVRRLGVPLGDIVLAAERVGGGDYSTRVVEHGPPSLRSVARAFNSMTTTLQSQDRQRRDLMAEIAHELRTPLTVVQGRLEGMLDGVYPRDDAVLAGVLDDTRILARLVEDLRTLANAEAGRLVLEREPTDLAVLIRDVKASFSAQAEAGRVTMTTVIPESVPIVDVDPLRVWQVLSNLVSNGLAHTPAGGTVTIAAEAAPDRIVVKVTDTGAGISPTELPKIFDRFYKGTASKGSGLGLTIARNLVLAHGGAIQADSRLGEGTTITFTLPIRQA
jgi:signal transduction histidine kinase